MDEECLHNTTSKRARLLECWSCCRWAAPPSGHFRFWSVFASQIWIRNWLNNAKKQPLSQAAPLGGEFHFSSVVTSLKGVYNLWRARDGWGLFTKHQKQSGVGLSNSIAITTEQRHLAANSTSVYWFREQKSLKKIYGTSIQDTVILQCDGNFTLLLRRLLAVEVGLLPSYSTVVHESIFAGPTRPIGFQTQPDSTHWSWEKTDPTRRNATE